MELGVEMQKTCSFSKRSSNVLSQNTNCLWEFVRWYQKAVRTSCSRHTRFQYFFSLDPDYRDNTMWYSFSTLISRSFWKINTISMVTICRAKEEKSERTEIDTKNFLLSLLYSIHSEYLFQIQTLSTSKKMFSTSF